VWFWTIMRRLGVPPSSAVIQTVMDEFTSSGHATQALAIYDEFSKRQQSNGSATPTLGLMHSVMRAHSALRDIEAVIKTYALMFQNGLTPQSEADGLLVRALLQHAPMREMAFTTYHKKFGISRQRVMEAQASGVLIVLIDACALLDAERAAAELKKLCAFREALTEHEYAAAINVCRHHGFGAQEQALWRERHALARSGARVAAPPAEAAVRKHYG
jgi:DnaJ-domain-containing protein 1